ncbi:MAG TPA: DinB family protein, partial [Terracidiphilus sp.]|nr:DinB family protein [Terracidiphilus sp.]
PAHAQDKKEAAVKPPDSQSKVILDSWNDIGRKLIAMAEDFPEDKYDFKPNPVQRSFAEQLIHAAHGINIFVELGKGEKPHLDEPKRSDFKNKAAVAEYVRKAFADGAAVISSKGDSGMNELVIDPWNNQQFRLYEQAWFYLEHAGEHYGQLVVYYRVAGLVPPASRPRK